jgi:hypothetical protein
VASRSNTGWSTIGQLLVKLLAGHLLLLLLCSIPSKMRSMRGEKG